MSDLPLATADLQSDSSSTSATTPAEPVAIVPAAAAGPASDTPARRPRRARGRGRNAARSNDALPANQAGACAETRATSASDTRRKNRQPAAEVGAARVARSHPLLSQLAQHYPQLFGEELRPLKRGIFQDLVERHGQEWPAEELKTALALHTRSTRYLSAVAAGIARHDLAGQAVEATAPEHVHHALLEVFKRRQQRSQEDLQPKLRRRLVQAFEASGLSREDYVLLVRNKNEAINQLLDEALAEAALQAARDEALLRAYEASGLDVLAFSASYGRDPRQVQRTLDSAQRRRAGQA